MVGRPGEVIQRSGLSLAVGLLVATGLLGACALPEREALPDVGAPLRYTHASEVPALAADPVPVPVQAGWWRNFGDPRLDALVARGLAANHNLAAAGLILERARLQAGLTGLVLQPVLAGSVGRTDSRVLGQRDTNAHGYSGNLSANWEIDLWGRLRAQRDVAAWEARATAEDLEATRLALIAQLCRNHWQLAYLNQSLAVSTETLLRLERTQALVAAQRAAGAVSRLEVEEAAQNLERQKASHSALLQQRDALRSALTVLLGGEAWPASEEAVDLAQALSPDPRPGLPADLLGRRPDLRAAELRLREAHAQIKAVARSYYPALSLTGSLGQTSTSLADLVRNPLATLGAGVSLPFLNFQQARYDTRIADKSFEIAVSQFRNTLLTAFGEVDTALSARTRLRAQLEAADRSLVAAREIEQRYAVRYRSGAVSLRIWLDAQQTLRDAELARAQTRLSLINNDVSLFEVLGGAY